MPTKIGDIGTPPADFIIHPYLVDYDDDGDPDLFIGHGTDAGDYNIDFYRRDVDGNGDPIWKPETLSFLGFVSAGN